MRYYRDQEQTKRDGGIGLYVTEKLASEYEMIF